MSKHTPLTEDNDERHWRTAGISEAERAEWIAVDQALQPFLHCEPNDHHPSCCPAVIAVMEALVLGNEGGVHPPRSVEWFAPNVAEHTPLTRTAARAGPRVKAELEAEWALLDATNEETPATAPEIAPEAGSVRLGTVFGLVRAIATREIA